MTKPTGERILETAEQLDADLIITGVHGLTHARLPLTNSPLSEGDLIRVHGLGAKW